MAPKPRTPAYFGAFLARSWAEGTTTVRHLFSDIRHRGYTGSYSHLVCFLAPWRNSSPSRDASEPSSLDRGAHAPPPLWTLDPMTVRQILPLTPAALCVKPRGQMATQQIINVDALKAALAMRFRGQLRGGKVERLDIWLDDARAGGIYGMLRLVRTLRRHIEVVRDAVRELLSNGQTEGQINRLKALKRAMYGRADTALIRARMIPLQGYNWHQD